MCLASTLNIEKDSKKARGQSESEKERERKWNRKKGGISTEKKQDRNYTKEPERLWVKKISKCSVFGPREV